MSISSKNPAILGFGAAIFLCASAGYLSCRGATQVRVEILTDAACEDLNQSPNPVAAVYVGKDGHAVEAMVGRVNPGASSFKCSKAYTQPDGRVINYLGSLYVTPSGDRDAPFAFSVIAGIGAKSTLECGKPEDPEKPSDPKRYENCIVSRRALNFIEHDALRLPVFLSLDCEGVACEATTTCRKGTCVDAEIPDVNLCKTEEGCDENDLSDAGTAGTGGAGGASGSGGAGGNGAGGAGGAPAETPPCGYIAVGSDHTCMAKSDKTVWCWGSNSSNGANLLGDVAAPHPSPTPFQVPGISDAIHISARYYHTCAVHADATVSCWGWNTNAQVGTNPVVSVPSPFLLSGFGNIKETALGRLHSCAITTDGKVYCWGDNTNSLLGVPAGANANPAPVHVSKLPPVRMVSAAAFHTCAVTQANALWCWGYNDYNQLGDGNGAAGVFSEPIEIIPSGVKSVVVSGYGNNGQGAATCVLYTSGQVVCWGSNEKGQLGTGDTNPRAKPADSVPAGGFNDIEEIVSGRYHVCARHQSGSVSCWGFNDYLQIGSTAAALGAVVFSPVTVEGLSDAEHLFAGGFHTCALRKNKQMVCWGSNFSGEIGNGQTNMNVPVPVSGPSICDP